MMNIKILFSSVVIAASGMLGTSLQAAAADITIVQPVQPPPEVVVVPAAPPPPERIVIETPPPPERVVRESPEPRGVEETKTTETRRGILGRKKESTTTTRTETRP